MVPVLRTIYQQLNGNEQLLASKHSAGLPTDFHFPKLQLIVEVDELQHFTTDRLTALRSYPSAAKLAFDLGLYSAQVMALCDQANAYRSTRQAVDFPFQGGRRAQRAYFDACRDLLAPQYGLRVLRVPAPDRRGDLAYEAFVVALKRL